MDLALVDPDADDSPFALNVRLDGGGAAAVGDSVRPRRKRARCDPVSLWDDGPVDLVFLLESSIGRWAKELATPSGARTMEVLTERRRRVGLPATPAPRQADSVCIVAIAVVNTWRFVQAVELRPPQPEVDFGCAGVRAAWLSMMGRSRRRAVYWGAMEVPILKIARVSPLGIPVSGESIVSKHGSAFVLDGLAILRLLEECEASFHIWPVISDEELRDQGVDLSRADHMSGHGGIVC